MSAKFLNNIVEGKGNVSCIIFFYFSYSMLKVNISLVIMLQRVLSHLNKC